MGVPIEENKFLYSLNYADDQVITAQDAEDLEFILKRLNKAYKEGGLTINFNNNNKNNNNKGSHMCILCHLTAPSDLLT